MLLKAAAPQRAGYDLCSHIHVETRRYSLKLPNTCANASITPTNQRRRDWM